MKFKFISKEKISHLPKNPGVYAFKEGNRFLYIGKTANLRERVKNHFRGQTFKDYLFLDKVEKIGFIKTDSEIEALILEANLIKKYKPKYNIVWKDDKNYFFVGITKEEFPRIFITHQTKLKSIDHNLKPEFLGPFVDGKALKQTLKILRKVFPYRSCRKIPKKPCLWYQLDRCPAPCLLSSKVTKELEKFQKQIKKECKEGAKNIKKILKGKSNLVLKSLKKEMEKAAKKKNFELAAKRRDQFFALEKILSHAKIFIAEKKPEIIDWEKIQKSLSKILKTKKKISKIEAYDVSNIRGKKATGAMVAFENGLPNKNLYRRFKIKVSGKPNDIAMLKEVLIRRFNHPEWPLPDLILIDGGKSQLNTAIKSKIQGARKSKRRMSRGSLKYKKIKVMAIAKRKNKLFVEGQKKPLLLKNLPREVFNLILQLRDEAHRFALSYHKKLREIDFQKSA